MHTIKSALTFAAIAIIAGSISFNFLSQEKKGENHKNGGKIATPKAVGLKETFINPRTEFQKFRRESEKKINANGKKIAGFKIKAAFAEKERKAVYERDIAWMEQRNIYLKTMLESYQDEGQEKWEAFKTKFSHDMDELSTAFTDFEIINMK